MKESADGDVLFSAEGAVAYIDLNRPERLNAMTTTMQEEIHAHLDLLEGNETIRVIVIRGKGRAFCAGADLQVRSSNEDGNRTPWDDVRHIQRNVDLYARLWEYSKPVIAQVHGYCLAAGVMLATSCDITIASDDARIGWPKLPVGGGYISHMAAWYIGPKRAKEMSFMAGSEIDGRTAAEWGLVNRSVPLADLRSTVDGMALRISRMPASLLELKKSSINGLFNDRGYASALRDSALADALAHLDPAAKRSSQWIKEFGLKGAIERYESEGL